MNPVNRGRRRLYSDTDEPAAAAAAAAASCDIATLELRRLWLAAETVPAPRLLPSSLCCCGRAVCSLPLRCLERQAALVLVARLAADNRARLVALATRGLECRRRRVRVRRRLEQALSRGGDAPPSPLVVTLGTELLRAFVGLAPLPTVAESCFAELAHVQKSLRRARELLTVFFSAP